MKDAGTTKLDDVKAVVAPAVENSKREVEGWLTWAKRSFLGREKKS